MSPFGYSRYSAMAHPVKMVLTMSSRPLLPIATLFICCLFSACQQVAWKAGGTSDDLKRDEQACRAQIATADDEALKQCLRTNGWTVTNFKQASVAEEIAPENIEPAPTPTDKSAAAATTTVPSAPIPSTAANKPIATAAKPKDPMQRQSIQTWWKAGAQASDFKAAESVCISELGEQHTPDYAQHLYTRALMSCLQTRGWHAGYDPVYTPLR